MTIYTADSENQNYLFIAWPMKLLFQVLYLVICALLAAGFRFGCSTAGWST
jgi:hypothetical protein